MSAIRINSPTTPSGSRIENQTRTLPPLDTAAVDQFFAAAGKADQRLSLANLSSRARHTTEDGDLDVLPGGMWLVDQA
jgi:hypothetical protein